MKCSSLAEKRGTTAIRSILCCSIIILCFPLFSIINPHSDGIVSAKPALKSAVDVREGPGSFFPMVGRLQKSASITLIEESDGWHHIQSAQFKGWIPALALDTREEGKEETEEESLRDRFARAFDDDTEQDALHVSEAQVVAAVKGFIENHIAATGEELVDYSDYFEYRYRPEAYLQFRNSRITRSDWQNLKRRNRLSQRGIPDPKPEMDMIGWATGNRIAQIGIYNNPSLQQYLNHIAMLVTESSHRPDLPINVIILDTDDIAGYAVPGGLIFVTLGTIRLMRTEAEFAAFIGHEIAHLCFQHGVTELEKRGTRIAADDATRRMEEAISDFGMTDERYAEITRELQQIADDFFEFLVADRLHAYEEEADLNGMLYAVRAGYDGRSLYNIIERISLFHYEPKDDRISAWYGNTLNNRLEALRNELQKIRVDGGNHHSAKWDSMTRYLTRGR